MWLVNERLGERVYLGKYYPSTGWYNNGDVGRAINDAFDKDTERSGIGPTDWKIEYDITEEDVADGEPEFVAIVRRKVGG
jgi:hypothetical protein